VIPGEGSGSAKLNPRIQQDLSGRLSRVMLSQKVGVHDPPLPRLYLGSYPFDVVHELVEISCHENFVLGADIGASIDVDVGIADCLE
jgi:hypothetical protein